mgnify:FL=1
MREFNLLGDYPEPKKPRYVNQNLRTIKNRITASNRGKEFFDGDRNDGYGGMVYDGRWKSIAKRICDKYGIKDNSKILQINCEKGFLLNDLQELNPKIKIYGLESSKYAIDNALPSVKKFINYSDKINLEFEDNFFDFVIAIGTVYSLNLSDAIKCLKEIQRVSKGKSFITLGAYENEKDKKLFSYWTLLGSTILKKNEWIEVLKYSGFTGDYKFNTAASLNLIEKI